MSSPTTRRLDDRYTVLDGEIFLSGVQALVRLPLDIHRHDKAHDVETKVFISGYEGSPLGGYDLELLRNTALLANHGTVLKQGLNEELAANAVQGTQQALTRANVTAESITGIWYGKAPGLDRATDAIRHANLGGTHPRGGVVALVGDDTTAKSSTVPSSSEIAMAELCLPILVPADAQDVLDLGIHAVALSRISGLWAGLKVATNTADATSTALVSPSRVTPVFPDITFDGVAYRHVPTAKFLQPVLGQLEDSLYNRRLVLARRYARANQLNTFAVGPDDRVGVIAAGSTYLDVSQALTQLGNPYGIRVLKLGMVWPLDVETVREFAQGLREIVVVEEKRSFIESGVKEVLYDLADKPMVSGKTSPDGQALLRIEADLNPDLIAVALAKRLAAHDIRFELSRPPVRQLLPLAVRTPFFCSGCPHNRSTQVPAGSIVGAGIGCHGMAALLPEESVGDVLGLTQMGGEGAPWIGMSEYVPETHMFQNLGDGTFHHSGSLAVRAAVAAGVNVTFKILYNSAVAMTGGQQAVGQLAVPEMTRLLLAEGVRRVVITTEDASRYDGIELPAGVKVHRRDELLPLQEVLSKTAGVTVLIHDQECATELRRKRKRNTVEAPVFRPYINERVCEGCGDCGVKSNCLSVQPVETEHGRKTRIHQSSCNQDLSCLDGDCPSFLTIVPGTKTSTSVADLGSLPAPECQVEADGFRMRITGIGGTGVVTVAQIVATAAGLEGFTVRAMDQTGLAQKGGAVVSDIKLSTGPLLAAAKLGAGECDLYLGCDALVASAPVNLAACSATRTVPVVSTSKVPTGAMVISTAASYPAIDGVTDQISAACRTGGQFHDAHALTRQLFDDDQYANIFLLGVAHQSGNLPVGAAAIEQAIGLNGVAVARNIQAFRRGRQLIASPPEFAAALAEVSPASTAIPWQERPLDELIAARTAELVAYQDKAYAKRYSATLKPVITAAGRVRPGETTLAAAAAQHLYKLMAYKDEYEVARLSLDPKLHADIARQFGADATYSYRLHPPFLRALGVNRKLTFGPWVRHVFSLLHRLRRLRGTRLDLFGYARVRRLERELIVEFEELLASIATALTSANYEIAVQLASAPDVVRGYEGLKEASVVRYREHTRELRLLMTATPAEES